MPSSEASGVARSIARHLLAGALVCVALVGGIGGWAATTNLAGAIVAPGSFVVDSYVKKVQHPTGGVVGALRVREGQHVEAGDVLIRLDATQVRANLALVTKRLDELNARRARLEAERDDRDAIVFPSSLVARTDDPVVAEALRGERQLFAFRRQSRVGKKDQLRERIVQYELEISGLKAQEQAFDRGLKVLEQELEGLRGLHEKGFVTVQRLNALDREAATLGGERGEAMAGQAQAAGRIAEAKLQILQIDSDLKTEVGRELRDVQAQIGEFVERRVAAEDQLRRIAITAPRRGAVHQLTIHAPGEVISPADTIMLIVPDEDTLALDARVAPRDIDQVGLGQPVVLRMSAFNQRTTPELNGRVTRIGADLTENQRTGTAHYVIRISVSPEELSRLDGLTIVPGMPAEAFIQTGERTALSYVVKPLTDQLAHVFREE